MGGAAQLCNGWGAVLCMHVGGALCCACMLRVEVGGRRREPLIGLIYLVYLFLSGGEHRRSCCPSSSAWVCVGGRASTQRHSYAQRLRSAKSGAKRARWDQCGRLAAARQVGRR